MTRESSWGHGLPALIIYVYGGGQEIFSNPYGGCLGRFLQTGFIAIASMLPAFLFYLFGRQQVAKQRENFYREAMLLDANVWSENEAKNKYGPLLDTVFDTGNSPFSIILLVTSTALIVTGWITALAPIGLLPTEEVSLVSFFRPDLTPFTLGFLGAYFFTINLVYRRYVRADLTPKTYAYVTMRLITTYVLVWAIGSTLRSLEGPIGLAAVALALADPRAAGPEAAQAPGDTDAAPKLRIASPLAMTQLAAGEPAELVAQARDANGRDLGNAVLWSSSRDGVLGSGPRLTRSLSAGVHTLTARVQDAAGSIASEALDVEVTDGGYGLLAAGDIATCESLADEAKADLLDRRFGTILTLGDNADRNGSLAEFERCYAPSWGRQKARTRPALGNHEYRVARQLRRIELEVECAVVLGEGHAQRERLRIEAGGVTEIDRGIGAALAAWHVWIQGQPAGSVPACGMGLNYMLDTMPLTEVISKVLKGSGECAEQGWLFMGLAIPSWTFVFFVAMIAASTALVRRD